MSPTEHPVTPYFIELDVAEIGDPEERVYFNKIPTSFSLEQEQADMLINTARRLLRKHTEYQKLRFCRKLVSKLDFLPFPTQLCCQRVEHFCYFFGGIIL